VKRRLVRSIIFVAVIGLGAAIAIAVPRLPERGGDIPTARVVKGPLSLTVHANGELRAGRTMTLVTPPVGGMLRITRLIPTGVGVKSGDVVVEFDPADHRYTLEQAKSEVAEAEQEIVKMKADAAVQAAQDQVTLLTARFDVRRAELDVSGNEFIGAIDAQKNLLSLEEAKRRLAQLEEDVKSRAATSQASLAVVEEKRNKAMLAMQRAEQVIDSLVVTAPLDGVVSVQQNRDAMGGMMIWGMAMPEYREGDSIWPGRPIADVIESGRMELRAKVDENDRANLTAGQEATVDIDTLPAETFKARVGTLSAQARRTDFFESNTTSRQFDVSFLFDQLDPRMKAGASASVTITGKEIPDALTLPRQAIFQKNGKTHVFVKTGDRFEQREVKVVQRTESRAALSGLAEGTEVALIDPNALRGTTPSTSSPPLPPAGAPK
jgi:multidrug efflux pump subunit AcrA (membrane-fusion protein)